MKGCLFTAHGHLLLSFGSDTKIKTGNNILCVCVCVWSCVLEAVGKCGQGLESQSRNWTWPPLHEDLWPLAVAAYLTSVHFKAKLLFLRRRNRLLFTFETRKRQDIWIHLRQGLNGDRLVACHLNGNLKKICRRERVGEGVYSKSVCMSSSQNGNVSCYGFVPGGRGCRRGEVFRSICLFEKVCNAPSTILKTLNLCVTWKTEGDGRRTRSTEDSSDGVLRAEIFHIVSYYAKLTLSHFSNVTCLQDVCELPGN